MVPLRLSSAWTTWKAQGETILEQIVIDLGKREAEAGLTYTAFSRATAIRQVGLYYGVDTKRLTTSIANNAKLQLRLVEQQRLEQIAEATRASWPPSTD
jgi:hypothetical protein